MNVVLRLSREADQPALRRLAGLDSQPLPRGRVLLAEVDGVLRAAHAVEQGATIADPFHPTAELVRLLEAHAHPRRQEQRSSRPLGGRLLRRAPWPA